MLLIEDDQETVEVAGDFRGRGYHVERTANGLRGLAQAWSGQVDVLVVDRLLSAWTA